MCRALRDFRRKVSNWASEGGWLFGLKCGDVFWLLYVWELETADGRVVYIFAEVVQFYAVTFITSLLFSTNNTTHEIIKQ